MLLLLSIAHGTAAPSAFDGLRAYADLCELSEAGGRHYGAPGREAAVAQLEKKMAPHCQQVLRQRFKETEPISGIEYSLVNIVCRVKPGEERRVLLGSHYDTRLWAEEDSSPSKQAEPIAGANDGTSGVAVLVEVLRSLETQPLPPGLGLDIVLFDGEEFGRPGHGGYCKGSEHFVEELPMLYPQSLPEAAVILDMVGDRELEFKVERNSYMYAPEVVESFWKLGEARSAETFSQTRVGPILDDHAPLGHSGIPAILVIDLDYAHWHTHSDTPDKCSAESLQITGDTVTAWLQTLQKP
jgi:glutaminyl-peptide cyclotransferase